MKQKWLQAHPRVIAANFPKMMNTTPFLRLLNRINLNHSHFPTQNKWPPISMTETDDKDKLSQRTLTSIYEGEAPFLSGKFSKLIRSTQVATKILNFSFREAFIWAFRMLYGIY